MNFSKVHIMQKERDPLNLGSLPLVEPPEDNWPQIRQALIGQKQHQRIRRIAGASLAAAAVLALAIGLVIQQPHGQPEAPGTPPALDSLVMLSQQLESGIRSYRAEMGGLPTDALVYRVELEDLIAQVDDELSARPDSTELWSQRVNLLLDLSQLYENQLRRDYHEIASL